jgi:hypothetical protein
MTEEEILNTLDNANDGYYCSFVELGHVYSYLIDTRLNVFVNEHNHWTIAVERLGYNPRAGTIILEIHYYGNCLINLEHYNKRPTSTYDVFPIDEENFNETVENEGLKPDAKFWLVKGQQVALSHHAPDYKNVGIELKSYTPNEIRVEEAGRLAILKNRELFRATDNELYKSIPNDLKKILVLNEWFHKDFPLEIRPTMSDEQLRKTYKLNKSGLDGMNFERFSQTIKLQEVLNDQSGREIWEHNRPSVYETWPLLAKVIVTKDPKQYQPTLKANTHWANWPESGSM